MTNRSKAKGTHFEVLIRDYFIENWDDLINRLALAGTKDCGDLANFRIAGEKIAVECKDHRQMELAAWVAEAQKEAENLGALASVVVHKRRGKGAAQDQYVTTTLGDFMKIIALSEGRGSVPL